MAFRHVFTMTALAALLACGQPPVLESTGSAAAQDAPYPALVPIAQLLAGAPSTPQITPQSTADLAARLSALRARAVQMRGNPVVDAPTKARMRAAISRAALR